MGSLRRPAALQEHPQEPLKATWDADAVLLRGVSKARQKVVRKSAVEAARKANYVFDDVLPMNFVPPSSWGTVRTRRTYLDKGFGHRERHLRE